MSYVRVTRTDEEYFGLSGDVKPTTGIAVGTQFTEMDTGAKYMWFNGTWEDDLTLIYAVKQAMEQ